MNTNDHSASGRFGSGLELSSVGRFKPVRRLPALFLAALAVGLSLSNGWAISPLTSLDYHIAGTFLLVTPSVLTVPKGIAGSILVSVVAGGSTNNAAVAQLASGAYVQAIIRGPSFPTPQRLVSAPNAPLMLPLLNLVGDYELDNIALVDDEINNAPVRSGNESILAQLWQKRVDLLQSLAAVRYAQVADSGSI